MTHSFLLLLLLSLMTGEAPEVADWKHTEQPLPWCLTHSSICALSMATHTDAAGWATAERPWSSHGNMSGIKVTARCRRRVGPLKKTHTITWFTLWSSVCSSLDALLECFRPPTRCAKVRREVIYTPTNINVAVVQLITQNALGLLHF